MTHHTNNTSGGENALLTAYALGELDPQSDDYKAIAAKLADDPTLQAQADQIAALGSQLTQSYEQAAGPGLDASARAELLSASPAETAPLARIHPRPGLTRRLLPYTGVAACTALATAGVFMATQPQTPTPPIVAHTPPTAGTADDLPPEDQAAPLPAEPLDRPITIKFDKTPLLKALAQIGEAAGLTIDYNVADPNDVGQIILHPITLDLTDRPAREAIESTLNQVNTPYPAPDYILDFHLADATTINVDKRQTLQNAGLAPVMAAALAAVPLEERIEGTRAQLQTPVNLNTQNFPLDLALHQIKEQTGVQFFVNWQAAELVGIAPDDFVTIQLQDIPAGKALELILQQVSADAFDDDKLGSRIAGNYVQISTLRDLKAETTTKVYDIRDLLVTEELFTQVKNSLLARAGGGGSGGGGGGLFGDDSDGDSGTFGYIRAESEERLYPGLTGDSSAYNTGSFPPPRATVPNFQKPPSFDLNDALSGTSSGGSGNGLGGSGSLFGRDDSEDEDLPTRQELVDQYHELIYTTVGDPDEWLDEESTLTELNGNIIVKTTPENHEQITHLLGKLRKERADGIEKIELADGEFENVVEMMLKDIERGMVDIEERRVLRELERERRERFADLTDNPFKLAEHEPLSTFSVDVDTASYAYGRRTLLNDKALPAPDSVRIEEWINYFDYGYTAPVVDPDQLPNGRLTTAALEKFEAADESFAPFATDVEVVTCPWTEGNQIVRIGIQAMEVDQSDRPPAHLVFLLDVSGSMDSRDKLGLVQRGLPLLLEQLNDNDKVSIVVYAGASGLVLEAAEASDKQKINDAIQALTAGGSTAGGAGIRLAYDIADKHFVAGGINRVILCTDGDFNVGTSDTDELVELVKAKANPEGAPGNEAANKGVYLSVMGFGTGNLNDEMMEKITNAGNGNYHYIDSVNEAVKTMSEQAGGTLVTVAKDVKLQLEFNPARVAGYRLIGYENRVLANEDFNNDTVDAGDIGAGHSVTALYEIVPVPEGQDAADDGGAEQPVIDELRYQKPRGLAEAAELPELLTLKLRYKPVDAKAEQGTSRKVVQHVPAEAVAFEKASPSTRFASSVAAMGMILRGSPHKGDATALWVVKTAEAAKANDPHGYRQQFVELATQAGLIQAQRDNAFREGLAE